MAITSLDCPHCKTKLLRLNYGLPFRLDCPLKICPRCGGEYLMPHTFEWSIISPLHKFFYCFLAEGSVFIIMLSLWASIYISFYTNLNWLGALIGIALWISLCILRFKIFDSDKAAESYKRTKNNPEYIKKLSDLGCTSIDIRIDPYYK